MYLMGTLHDTEKEGSDIINSPTLIIKLRNCLSFAIILIEIKFAFFNIALKNYPTLTGRGQNKLSVVILCFCAK